MLCKHGRIFLPYYKVNFTGITYAFVKMGIPMTEDIILTLIDISGLKLLFNK